MSDNISGDSNPSPRPPGDDYMDWLVAVAEARFDYALTGAIFVLLVLSVALSTRLGYSYPVLLMGAWGVLGLAGILGIFRVRGGLAEQRRRLSVSTTTGKGRCRRLQTYQIACLILGLLLNAVFLSVNLWLDNIDQQQNGSSYDDNATCQTDA